ncbi:prosaposin-like [Corythoichthys intestinalis]|uniref:prosaposin-like n=1 Tax=Corythoichthys intestinalis TaxID=161448 RepID=UPI0025A62B30|nr:prosaposin-like [Corythoichthys intestinalis]XP_061797077.1 prosaposin-like [Nerophis lumbriciformis]
MLLLTLLFVSSALAIPLLDTEQCARGASYWCRNVRTASLCGAVTHCQQNVWSKPQMKTVPCNLCKEVIMVISHILKDNATEAEVLGYMEKGCQLIPDQGLSAECKEIVDNYYPFVMGIILEALDDPGVACGAIGLCRSKLMFQDQPLSNEIPQVDLSQPMTPFLLNVPGLLYPQEITKPETSVKSSDVLCQDCIKLMTDAQAAQKANSSFVDDLIAKFEDNCEQMGPGLSDLCKEYIGQYGSLVFQKIMSMDPKDFCCSVGFCNSVKNSAPMLKLQAAKIVPAAKTLPALSLVPAIKVESAKLAKPMVRLQDSPTCAICEFVMKQLESMLEDHATEEEVIEAVEKVCTYLPSSLTAQCKDLIQTYGEAIIDLLVKQADPKAVCTMLAFCKEATHA